MFGSSSYIFQKSSSRERSLSEQAQTEQANIKTGTTANLPKEPKEPDNSSRSVSKERSSDKKEPKKQETVTSNILDNRKRNQQDNHLFSQPKSQRENLFDRPFPINIFSSGANLPGYRSEHNLFERANNSEGSFLFPGTRNRNGNCPGCNSNGNLFNNHNYQPSNLPNPNNPATSQVSKEYVQLHGAYSILTQDHSKLKQENSSLKQENKKLKQELQSYISAYHSCSEYSYKLKGQINQLTKTNTQLQKYTKANKEKKNSGTYDFSKFAEEKVEKKETSSLTKNMVKETEQSKTFEEMEQQLAAMRRREVTLKKKVEMWRRKYVEIQEEKLELEMEVSGELDNESDESYDDLLSVSSLGAFKKEKTGPAKNAKT